MRAAAAPEGLSDGTSRIFPQIRDAWRFKSLPKAKKEGKNPPAPPSLPEIPRPSAALYSPPPALRMAGAQPGAGFYTGPRPSLGHAPRLARFTPPLAVWPPNSACAGPSPRTRGAARHCPRAVWRSFNSGRAGGARCACAAA